MVQSLIVDDEDALRDVLGMILEDAGFVCLQAADGREALRLMRASPDRLVVLLDLMMPRMDGRAVLEAVEAEPALAERHAIILLTAAGRTLSLPLARLVERLGVTVVGKPFDLDVLLQAVARARARLAGPADSTSSPTDPQAPPE